MSKRIYYEHPKDPFVYHLRKYHFIIFRVSQYALDESDNENDLYENLEDIKPEKSSIIKGYVYLYLKFPLNYIIIQMYFVLHILTIRTKIL